MSAARKHVFRNRCVTGKDVFLANDEEKSYTTLVHKLNKKSACGKWLTYYILTARRLKTSIAKNSFIILLGTVSYCILFISRLPYVWGRLSYNRVSMLRLNMVVAIKSLYKRLDKVGLLYTIHVTVEHGSSY